MTHLHIPSDFARRLMAEFSVATRKGTKQEEKVNELMGTGEFVKKQYNEFGMNGRRYKRAILYRADGSFVTINHKGGLGGMMGGLNK